MPAIAIEEPYFLQNTEEQPNAEESKIIGEIPSWLQGTILSVAPGVFDLPNGSFNHLLDGLALISRFEIGQSSVKFSKRFLQSEAYKKAIKAGKPCSVELGTNPGPKKGMFAKLKPHGPYDSTDNALGVVRRLGPKDFLVMSDTSYFHKINPHTLETLPLKENHALQAFDLQSVCPHMLEDPETKDIYSIGCSLSGTSIKYHVVRMRNGDESKTFETLCSIPCRWYSLVSLLRAFAITKKYVIFMEQPVVFNALKLAATNLKGYTARDCIEWKSGDLNRFYIMDKNTGKLIMQKYEIYSDQPFNTIITINAYEEGNSIIFDCVSTNDLELIDLSFLENIRKLENSNSCDASKIQRFVIPLLNNVKDNVPENVNLLESQLPTTSSLNNKEINFSSKSLAKAIRKGGSIFLTSQMPFDKAEGLDFGQVNKNFVGRKYTHYYSVVGMCSINSSKYFGKICKVNMNTGEVNTWDPDGESNVKSRKYFVTNPLFVPKINDDENFQVNSEEDDDGVLISTCLSRKKSDRNFMVFIDSKSWKEIGRSYFDEKIPMWIAPTFIK